MGSLRVSNGLNRMTSKVQKEANELDFPLIEILESEVAMKINESTSRELFYGVLSKQGA